MSTRNYELLSTVLWYELSLSIVDPAVVVVHGHDVVPLCVHHVGHVVGGGGRVGEVIWRRR